MADDDNPTAAHLDGKPEGVATGGDLVVAVLEAFGVEDLFGLPGDQTPIYDAIYRRSGPRHILVRHEQAAAHMADAYARATGKVGVCDASVGPGATNLVSGIAEASTSGIPVIALVSDIRTDWRGRDSFQEVDQVGVFGPITKEVFSVDLVSRIPELLTRAFQIATTGRPGPVLVSLPLDVLKAEHTIDPASISVDRRYGRFPAVRMTPPAEDIAEGLRLLRQAERPVILAGGGVLASGASAEIQALAEAIDVPVATTFMGKGSLPERHPLALGPFGLLGRAPANEYVLGADVALAVGTRFTNVDTAAWRIPDPAITIVQIDVEPTQIGRNYPAALALPGDARSVLRAMLDLLDAGSEVDTGSDTDTGSEADPGPRPSGPTAAAVEATTSRWRTERGTESTVANDDTASPVHPLQVIRALDRAMADEDILICDSGFNQIWGGQYFEVGAAGRTYMGPRGSGVMGFALPAAIATSLVRPDRRVVALCGDGGFAMVLQELETARRTGAPITVCIMNNGNLQYIRENQRLLHGSRFISTDFSELDYAAIARAFGCVGIRVEHSGDLDGAIGEAIGVDRPAVVDVRILADAVPDRLSLQLPDLT